MVSQIRSEPWGWCGEAFAGVNARLTSALLQAVDKSSHVGSMCAAAGDDVTGSQRPRQHHVRRLCNRSTVRRISRWQQSMIEAGLLLVALASVAWPTWSFRWNKRLPSHSSFPHGSLPSTRPLFAMAAMFRTLPSIQVAQPTTTRGAAPPTLRPSAHRSWSSRGCEATRHAQLLLHTTHTPHILSDRRYYASPPQRTHVSRASIFFLTPRRGLPPAHAQTVDTTDVPSCCVPRINTQDSDSVHALAVFPNPMSSLRCGRQRPATCVLSGGTLWLLMDIHRHCSVLSLATPPPTTRTPSALPLVFSDGSPHAGAGGHATVRGTTVGRRRSRPAAALLRASALRTHAAAASSSASPSAPKRPTRREVHAPLLPVSICMCAPSWLYM
jgi:hypothetical protein